MQQDTRQTLNILLFKIILFAIMVKPKISPIFEMSIFLSQHYLPLLNILKETARV